MQKKEIKTKLYVMHLEILIIKLDNFVFNIASHVEDKGDKAKPSKAKKKNICLAKKSQEATRVLPADSGTCTILN